MNKKIILTLLMLAPLSSSAGLGSIIRRAFTAIEPQIREHVRQQQAQAQQAQAQQAQAQQARAAAAPGLNAALAVAQRGGVEEEAQQAQVAAPDSNDALAEAHAAIDDDAARAAARDRAAHDALRAADTYANLDPIDRLNACEAHFTNLIHGRRGWLQRLPVLNFLTIMTEYYNTYTEHKDNFTQAQTQTLRFLQGPGEWDVEEVVMDDINCRLGHNIETLRGLMDAFFVVMTPPLGDGELQRMFAEGYNPYENNFDFEQRLRDYFGLDGNDFPNNAAKTNTMTRLLYTKEILENMTGEKLGLLLGRIQEPFQEGDRNFCSFDGFRTADLAQRLERKDEYMDMLINVARDTGVAPVVPAPGDDDQIQRHNAANHESDDDRQQ